MTEKDWRAAFGKPTEEFDRALKGTLKRLEEKHMKKRFKANALLVAAALAILLAGAAFAASRLGVFDMLTVKPLAGADDMVVTNLGSSENELASMSVEQAVFDGQGVLLSVRLTPKDKERDVLLNAFFQEAREDEYEIKTAIPVEIADDVTEIEWKGKTFTISGDEVFLSGERYDVPKSLEAANEIKFPLYENGGVLYSAEQFGYEVVGRKDGKRVIGYWVDFESADIEINGMTAKAQEDGSVLVNISGAAENPLDKEKITLTVSATLAADETVPIDPITIEIPKLAEERRAIVEPVGARGGERFEIVSAKIVYTNVRAYITIDYTYEETADEPMGITFQARDAGGNIITSDGGGATNEGASCRETLELQSFEETPETIYLEAKVVGADEYLGSVECRVIPE